MIKVLLIVVQGKPEGKSIPLTGPTFKIGRSEACQLRPNSDQISREHAEVSIGAEAATIRDLGSRNGTMLNGRTLTGVVALKSGDLIQVGNLTFAVVIQGAAEVPATSSQPTLPKVAASPTKSLDDVSHDEIESWLIADNTRPTPDRPSGVYDGDTLTINAYKDTKAAAAPKSTPPAPAAPTPAAPPKAAAAPPPPEAPAPVAAAPAPAPVAEEKPAEEEEEFLYERLPEGMGDAEEGDEQQNEDDEEEAEDMPEEFIDESNPFYAAKKAQQQEPAKPVYKDSSDAANDILKKMLDRRRASRS
jgi:pSer/pThr/pTyr-binding forkhead associated (FHA) protein